jgi:hypothetical protein
MIFDEINEQNVKMEWKENCIDNELQLMVGDRPK